MRPCNHFAKLLATYLIAGTACCSLTWAKPPGGDKDAPYTIVPFRPTNFVTTGSFVTGLNDVGQAVGTATDSNNAVIPLHLDVQTGKYTVLQGGTRAEDVNNHNYVVGVEYGDGGHVGVFWSSPTSNAVVLPPLPGDVKSSAFAINDDGLVAGASWNDQGSSCAVVWRVVVSGEDVVQVGGPFALSLLPQATESFAVDVNEAVNGLVEVAGENAFDGAVEREAVVWTIELDADGQVVAAGLPVGLGTLGQGAPTSSFATALNNRGDVCGESDLLPVVAPAGDVVQPLPLPRNALRGRAWHINDVGEVVGKVDIARAKWDVVGESHACLWKGGKPIDLESQLNRKSGWDALKTASVINTAGVIGGGGLYDGQPVGFLMIPNGN